MKSFFAVKAAQKLFKSVKIRWRYFAVTNENCRVLWYIYLYFDRKKHNYIKLFHPNGIILYRPVYTVSQKTRRLFVLTLVNLD